MKAAPIVRALQSQQLFSPRLIHTGQHYDEAMSEVFLRELGMPKPAYNLSVGSGNHGDQTARILMAYEEVLVSSPPSGVIVLGDVNSTIACALAAVKLHIPVAHVEAGLRSFDRKMPEEINRLATDAISDLMFCTEPEGADQLRREGHTDERIHLVGNLMVDALMNELLKVEASEILSSMQLSAKNYYYSTLHRPSNVDNPESLKAMIQLFDVLASDRPFLFAAHPRTVSRMKESNCLPTKATLMPPQPYHDNLRLIQQSTAVISDSGGIQSETAILNVPCLLLRDTTEQPVVVELGTTELVGNDPANVKSAVDRVLAGQWKQAQPIPYWDGKAAQRIVDVLRERWL